MKHPETHNKGIDAAIFFASFLGISSMGYRLDILLNGKSLSYLFSGRSIILQVGEQKSTLKALECRVYILSSEQL